MPTLFTFQMRAYAAAHFPFGETLRIDWDDATGFLQSEYTGGEDGRAYPVTLYGDVRGEAESLDDAQARFSASIGNYLPLIAVAANAAIADPLPVATYGLDLSEPRPFLAYRTPLASDWFPPGKRLVSPGDVAAFFDAVQAHPHGDILHRACEAYSRALASLVPEQRLLSAEFAFIATESLSRCLARTDLDASGESFESVGHRRLNDMLLAIRRDRIFDGDAEAISALEKASHGFEHGHISVPEVRGLADPVLERALSLVRAALIDASGLQDPARATLLSDEYAEARGLVPVIETIMGEIARQDPSSPGPEPHDCFAEVEFEPLEIVAEQTVSGEIDLHISVTATLKQISENTEPRITESGMRAAHIKRREGSATFEVTRAEGRSDEGEPGMGAEDTSDPRS